MRSDRELRKWLFEHDDGDGQDYMARPFPNADGVRVYVWASDRDGELARCADDAVALNGFMVRCVALDEQAIRFDAHARELSKLVEFDGAASVQIALEAVGRNVYSNRHESRMSLVGIAHCTIRVDQIALHIGSRRESSADEQFNLPRRSFA